MAKQPGKLEPPVKPPTEPTVGGKKKRSRQTSAVFDLPDRPELSRKGNQKRLDPNDQATVDLIRASALAQITILDLCAEIGIADSTFRRTKWAHKLYKQYRTAGLNELRRVQYLMARQSKNVPMLIWLGKNLLNQRDRDNEGDTGGKPKSPLRIEFPAGFDPNATASPTAGHLDQAAEDVGPDDAGSNGTTGNGSVAGNGRH